MREFLQKFYIYGKGADSQLPVYIVKSTRFTVKENKYKCICIKIAPVLSNQYLAFPYVLVYPIVVSRPLKGWLANSAIPDQTPQNAASDQGLHCLQIV